MNWSVADQENKDVDEVPDYGEAEGDELPWKEPNVGVEPMIVSVVINIVDVVYKDLMGDGPTNEADANDGEDNSERAQDIFPEEFGVLRVHFLAGGTNGEHGWGFETGNRLQIFGVEEREIKV